MFSIRERLRPFSHRPGTRSWIPGTQIEVISYPSRIVVGDRVNEIEAPVKQFSHFVDLERCCVCITSEKYRWYVWPTGEVKKERPSARPCERLFLGCQKKQDWELIRRRCDMREILPIWFQLGQMYSAKGSVDFPDVPPEGVVEEFEKLFLKGFRDIFVPRATDEDFHGLGNVGVHGDVAALLSEGAKLIRALFIDENHILPKLPPQFPAGKFCNLQMPYGELNIEWTKKQVRRVVLKAKVDADFSFVFPRAIKSYRVNGKVGKLVEIKSGMLYLLDQFQK